MELREWNLKLVLVLAVALLLVMGSFATVGAVSTQEAKDALFKEADIYLKAAQDKEAQKYSPKAYEKGMKYYNKAKSRKDLDDIKDDLDDAVEQFKLAASNAEKAMVMFKDAIKAREDALSADAPKYAATNWEKAEKKLAGAIESLEAGSEKWAKPKGKDANELYRAAELEAIKANYLQGAWALLKNAEEQRAKKYAPKTFEKAQSLVTRAEELLERERYNTEEAHQLAKQGKYEATHAITLHKTIEQIKDADKTFEDVILEHEQLIQEIANVAGVKVLFDQGLKLPVNEIKGTIKNLKAKNDQLTKALAQKSKEIDALNKAGAEKVKTIQAKDAEIAALKEEIAAMQKQLASLKSKEQQLKSDVEKQRIRKEKIARIGASLSQSEGSVFQDPQGNIIIRLYGLTFPKGKAVIQPQFFGLLTKVHKAIAEFPNCKLRIEGHTDSTGSESENLKLSSERAAAVMEYILANNPDITRSRIQAEGFGESRPVATNDTKAGRAKNRRIDVVIIPAQ